jgi:hypothetical protein
MSGPQGGHRPRELHQLGVRLIPVHPGDLIVLAVAVIVAVLTAAKLIAVRDHRNALREECGREKVALLTSA